ncbi:hypothetical protein SXCC_03078 [Gluconacetobacter sp. SXCC-1]|nr:hypothetical protein SXCC_03078 [Gluconacetobacter sp. SXCC-1]
MPDPAAMKAGQTGGMPAGHDFLHPACIMHARHTLTGPFFRPRHGVGAHAAHDLKLPRRCSPSTGNRMAYPSIRRPRPGNQAGRHLPSHDRGWIGHHADLLPHMR